MTVAAIRPLLQGVVRCDHCGTPALRVVGQTLVIEHVHHGQRHTTVLAIQQLLDKIAPSL